MSTAVLGSPEVRGCAPYERTGYYFRYIKNSSRVRVKPGIIQYFEVESTRNISMRGRNGGRGGGLCEGRLGNSQKVLYTSSRAFHSSGTTAVLLLLLQNQARRLWRGLQMYHATINKMTVCSIQSQITQIWKHGSGQPGSMPTMHSAFHANQTAHYIITGRIVHLTEF